MPRLFLFISLFVFLPGCTDESPPRLTWSFSVPPETRSVRIESWRAPDALLIRSGSGRKIVITARPVLQPLSQHGPEPDWRNKPAEEWRFGWETHAGPGILDLRCRGETLFPHHRYILEDVTITVGEGVAVERQKQKLEQAP